MGMGTGSSRMNFSIYFMTLDFYIFIFCLSDSLSSLFVSLLQHVAGSFPQGLRRTRRLLGTRFCPVPKHT